MSRELKYWYNVFCIHSALHVFSPQILNFSMLHDLWRMSINSLILCFIQLNSYLLYLHRLASFWPCKPKNKAFCNTVHMLQEGILGPPLKIISSCQVFDKADGYEFKYLFLAQQSPFCWHCGKYNGYHTSKKSNFKRLILCHINVSCSGFWRDQGRKHCLVK